MKEASPSRHIFASPGGTNESAHLDGGRLSLSMRDDQFVVSEPPTVQVLAPLLFWTRVQVSAPAEIWPSGSMPRTPPKVT